MYASLHDAQCGMMHVTLIVQIVLAKMAYAQWLKVHGKLKRPEMSKKQELELKECFELIDAGGSGTYLRSRLLFHVSAQNWLNR